MLCTKSHNHLRQFLRYGVRQGFFCHFGPFFAFLPLLPAPNSPENQDLEKMKKVSGDIILNLCNKKHDHMMYAYSGVEYDRQFFVILGHFFALLPHY